MRKFVVYVHCDSHSVEAGELQIYDDATEEDIANEARKIALDYIFVWWKEKKPDEE